MKIFGYHVHILISKKSIDANKIKMLKEGTAQLSKNPKRKEREEK